MAINVNKRTEHIKFFWKTAKIEKSGFQTADLDDKHFIVLVIV